MLAATWDPSMMILVVCQGWLWIDMLTVYAVFFGFETENPICVLIS